MKNSRPFRAQRKPVTALVENLESRVLMAATPLSLIESIDGTGNNAAHVTWGSANTDFIRKTKAAYADGISLAAGSNRPSARLISSTLSTQTTDIVNNRHLSDVVYVFGQFLDHDIDLTLSGTSESLNIAVPTGDPYFDPNSTGTAVIKFSRSLYDTTTGTSISNPRQQMNAITAFIDGSQVYGSDKTTADTLRTFAGGHLKTSDGNLLPLAADGSGFFLAGDIRVDENANLIAMQTLFMREHNRIADQIAADHPEFTDEQLYQGARKIVIAELQEIVYREFLPALIGQNAIAPYRGYNPNVNPSVTTEFSTAAFRFGHSMLDSEVARVANDGTDLGSVELKNAFFNPSLINNSGDPAATIDAFLKGATTGNAQEIDLKIVDDLRNFLFGPPGAGGFDLASLNIQRGRDHGLADYNTLRAAYGLPRVTSFAQITSDPTAQANLQSLYGSVNNIDPWVGGLTENHAPGSSMGPLFTRIIADQFTRLRDGDRFFYLNKGVLDAKQMDIVSHTTLSDIIERNTALTTVQPNVFVYDEAHNNIPAPPPLKPLAPPPPPQPARITTPLAVTPKLSPNTTTTTNTTNTTTPKAPPPPPANSTMPKAPPPGAVPPPPPPPQGVPTLDSPLKPM